MESAGKVDEESSKSGTEAGRAGCERVQGSREGAETSDLAMAICSRAGLARSWSREDTEWSG
jgi:hypothetical protein